MQRRTITVYADNGTEIDRYYYVTDVLYLANSPNRVAFTDDDGKRVIITGGVIIDEAE